MKEQTNKRTNEKIVYIRRYNQFQYASYIIRLFYFLEIVLKTKNRQQSFVQFLDNLAEMV